jgi:hypothetical protein
MAETLRHQANLERFQAKWIPVRVKKTRQNKDLEPDPVSINRIGIQDALRHDETSQEAFPWLFFR